MNGKKEWKSPTGISEKISVFAIFISRLPSEIKVEYSELPLEQSEGPRQKSSLFFLKQLRNTIPFTIRATTGLFLSSFRSAIPSSAQRTLFHAHWNLSGVQPAQPPGTRPRAATGNALLGLQTQALPSCDHYFHICLPTESFFWWSICQPLKEPMKCVSHTNLVSCWW